ncbi:hypothetical protein ACFQL7_23590 [Halocatena marina]|uniref:Uncharacterized protein n=1 Tax=Halocatena marina TaxID=2934937 RepID=A0ABD5YWW2_9EURY
MLRIHLPVADNNDVLCALTNYRNSFVEIPFNQPGSLPLVGIVSYVYVIVSNAMASTILEVKHTVVVGN